MTEIKGRAGIMLVVLFVSIMTGCVTSSYFNYKTAVKGIVVPDDKILVIARVRTDTDPLKLFRLTTAQGSNPSNQQLLAFWTPGEKLEKDSKSYAFPVSWGEYKASLVPRENAMAIINMLYFPQALVRSGEIDFHINFAEPLVTKLKKDDRVVYIGDIFLRFLQKNELGQQDPKVEVKDSFLKVQNIFKDFAVDKKGKPLPVRKRLITVGDWTGFDFTAIRTVTIYR